MTAVRGSQELGPLENYASNVSTLLLSPADRRAARYQNRQFLWEESTLERVRKCGRVRVAQVVGVRCAHGVAGFAGVATCCSVWACPVCNAKVMARRALEIGTAVTTAKVRGMFVGMVTLTMRHHQGQSLQELWDGLGHAWRRVLQGREWNERRALGWIGQLRSVEVTYSALNGWHVHVHALLFLHHGQHFERLSLGMFNRWSSGLQSMGLEEPLLLGQEWHEVRGMHDRALGQYLAKAVDPGSIGLELTSSQTKGATWSKTLPPWAYLNAARVLGDADALKVWREYEGGSHGRRQLTWSNGLRDLLELEDEQTDEEIAQEEIGTDADSVAYITAAGWDSLCTRDRVHLMPAILDTVKAGGWPALCEFLTAHEIEHFKA